MSLLRRVGAWVGLVTLFPLLLLYAVSGLVMPFGMVLVFLAVWIVLFVAALRLFRRAPFVVLGLPFLGLAVWLLWLWFEDVVLGWTA